MDVTYKTFPRRIEHNHNSSQFRFSFEQSAFVFIRVSALSLKTVVLSFYQPVLLLQIRA